MSDQPAELPAGVCVCGRDIPASSPSDWACGEPCQSAWLQHQANPDYPHPREIRDAAEQRVHTRMGSLHVPTPGPAGDRLGRVAPGTEIEVDGQPFVRVGSTWQPAGMWSPLRDDLADAVEYQRWCPTCRARLPTVVHESLSPGAPTGWQQCGACGHQWAGAPLVGVVESRGEPWPAIRLRLTDGARSATRTFTEAYATAHAEVMPQVMNAAWVRLERDLGGGFAEQDQPTARQQARAERRWVWRSPDSDHLHIDMRS